jgi:hypothetical protein
MIQTRHAAAAARSPSAWRIAGACNMLVNVVKKPYTQGLRRFRGN